MGRTGTRERNENGIEVYIHPYPAHVIKYKGGWIPLGSRIQLHKSDSIFGMVHITQRTAYFRRVK